MHCQIDPSGERFSRRTRGLEPSIQSSNTESTEPNRIQENSQAGLSITSNNSDIEQANRIPNQNALDALLPRHRQAHQWNAPSVQSVYSQNTPQQTIDTGITQTSITYQHPLNTQAIYENQQNPVQQAYTNSNYYESRPPRHPMTHPNIQQTVQHPIIQPNLQQSLNQNSDNIRPTIQPNPSHYYQHQQQVPYHNQMMSNQLADLTRTNMESQQLIANLQSQITQLLRQQNQMIQTVMQNQHTQSRTTNINSVSSLTDSQLIDPSGAHSNSTMVPTIVQIQNKSTTVSQSTSDQKTIVSNETSTQDNNMISQFIHATKATADNSKKITTFPKFSGKEFIPWYDSIISIISSPGWKSLYDSTTDDAVKVDPNNDLLADLYTALKRCLQGDAQDTMLHKKGI